MICVKCNAEYKPSSQKPGFIDECWDCGQETEDAKGLERLGGNMIWAHKTAPELEVKTLGEAEVFAARTARFGAGVTKSLTSSKTRAEREEYGGDL